VTIVGVGLGLCLRAGAVLLLRRQRPPYAGLWSLPGGKAEAGEGLCQAAEREIREELGCSAPAGALVALAREHYREEGGGEAAWLLGLWTFPAPAGTLPGCAWFPVADLAEVDMLPTDRLLIADALAAPPPPAPIPCRRALVEVARDCRPRVRFYG
jgi:8-oxo-dGTP diphosphatase